MKKALRDFDGVGRIKMPDTTYNVSQISRKDAIATAKRWKYGSNRERAQAKQLCKQFGIRFKDL